MRDAEGSGGVFAAGDALLGLVPRGDDFTAPKSVVHDYEAARAKAREHGLVIVGVVLFVGIDENEVEGPSELFDGLESRPHVDSDLAAMGALREMTASDGFRRGVDVASVKLTMIGQRRRHHESAIAGEHTDLENALRADERREHSQKLSFRAACQHFGAAHRERFSFDPF